jgi:hypothetical protein
MAKRLIGGKAERYRQRDEERKQDWRAARERSVEAALVKLGVDPEELKPQRDW